MTERIITPPARVAPVHLVATEKLLGRDTGFYSLILIFEAKNIEPIEKAIAKVMPKKKGARAPISPLHYSKTIGYRLRLRSESQVKAVNVTRKLIPLEYILPGAIVRVQATFVGREVVDGGVRACLGNIQLLRESSREVQEVDLGFDDIGEGWQHFYR